MSGFIIFLKLFFIIVIVSAVSEESSISQENPEYIPAPVPLGWSTKNTKLPLHQRGSAVPIIPSGHKMYQFYLHGPTGELVPKWLSLQQIQNFLLSIDPKSELNSLMEIVPEEDEETTPMPLNQNRPKDTVQQVIASVQQVISDKVAHTQHQESTPPTNSSGQSIKIPEVILHNLMVLQEHTTPWEGPVTATSLTTTEDSTMITPTITPSITPTINPPTDTSNAIIDNDETSDNLANAVYSPADNIPPTSRPLVDRWNSRLPSWTTMKIEEVNDSTDKNNGIETTDDYHIIPPSISETILPSDQEETTIDFENKVQLTTESSTDVRTQNTVVIYNEIITEMPLNTSSDSMLHIMSDEVDGFYQTTFGNMNNNVLDVEETMPENMMQFSTWQPEIIQTSTEYIQAQETTTISQLQSAVIDFATNIFNETTPPDLSPKPFEMEEKNDSVTLIDNISEEFIHHTMSPDLESANLQTPVNNDVNTIPLEIRDPLLPETIYDIHPIPDPTTTLPPQTMKPQNPYDIPTTFLNIVDAVTVSSNTTKTEVSQEESDEAHYISDTHQYQTGPLHAETLDMKPQYFFPVTGEDLQTKLSTNMQTTSSEEPTTMSSSEIQTILNGGIQTVALIETDANPIEEIQTRPDHNSFEPTTDMFDSVANENIIHSELTTQNPSTDSPTIFVTIPDMATGVATSTQSSSVVPTATERISEIQSTNNQIPKVTSFPQGSSSTQTTSHIQNNELTFPQSTVAQENSTPVSFSDYIYYYDDVVRYDSVIPPSQLANSANQSRIDLEALQSEGNHTEGDYFYDYIAQPVYLDDVPKEYYDYDVKPEEHPALNVSGDLDFPGPNATSPYHEHHHHGDHHADQHEAQHGDHHKDHHKPHHKDPSSSGSVAQLPEAPANNLGLEATVENLEPDVRKFVDVINDITFKVYKQAAREYKRRNFVMSPISLISTLNILFLGARGSTSAALNDLLLIDQFYTFNPHLILKNVTESLLRMADVHDVAFSKQLLVEQAANPYPMDFFSRTIDYFYGANISEIQPPSFDKEVRETVNEVISNATRGTVSNFLSEEPLKLNPPLSVVSTNFLHGRWSSAVTEADLFNMNFIRFPSAERALIRTVGLKKKMTINAGYSKEVGVTTAEIPFYSQFGDLSLILVMPGQQKNFVANGLAQVESEMTSTKWKTILRSMLPNEVMFKMPVFRHRSFHNFSSVLQDLGLDQLFKESEADFSGINTVKTLHLSDVIQLTEFQSCQVEEVRPVDTPSFRRVKRSNLKPIWGHPLAKSSDTYTGSGSYSQFPTFIYGLPMTEYLKGEKSEYFGKSGDSNLEKLNEKSDDLSLEISTGKTILQPFSHIPGEGMVAERLVDHTDSVVKLEEHMESTLEFEDKSPPKDLVNKDSVSQVHPIKLPKSSLAGSMRRKEESIQQETDSKYPKWNYESDDGASSYEDTMAMLSYYDSLYYDDYGEANMNLDPEDYRINRMGLPHQEYTDETKASDPASHGAYYRDNNAGVLAFDRAFMYAVRHNPTGLLLFVGRYLDPEGN